MLAWVGGRPIHVVAAYNLAGDEEIIITAATFQREGTTVVISNVPADVCPDCGEGYFDRETTDRLLALVNEAAAPGVKVQIREYVAA